MIVSDPQHYVTKEEAVAHLRAIADDLEKQTVERIRIGNIHMKRISHSEWKASLDAVASKRASIVDRALIDTWYRQSKKVLKDASI